MLEVMKSGLISHYSPKYKYQPDYLCINIPSSFFCSQWFRSAVIKDNAMPEGLMTLLFSNIDPIYEFHRGFLKELDQRLALW